MCNSCTIPFHGKYLQQCKTCGHPAHEKDQCVVGVPGVKLRIFNYSYRNCCCPADS